MIKSVIYHKNKGGKKYFTIAVYIFSVFWYIMEVSKQTEVKNYELQF